MDSKNTTNDNLVAPLVSVVPGEALTPTQKLIVRLRGVKESRRLTVPEIENTINGAISRTTLYRFFENGSELRYNFNQYTIEVLMMALLVDDTIESGDDVAKEKVAGFEAALQQKDEIISALREQIEQVRYDYERKCREYENRLALWQNQIAKKDERMDRKDRILDEKDAEIRKLRDKVDSLTEQLLQAKR